MEPVEDTPLMQWIFNGTLANPPQAWTSLSTAEQTLAINTCRTVGHRFPNNQRVRRGRQSNLLMAAAAAGKVDFLRYFRSSFPLADITITTNADISVFHLALDGTTVLCLHTPTTNNPAETAAALNRLLHLPCDTGSTPLHYAVNRPSALQSLLDLGCNPLATNNGKSIPLHYAGSRQVAELLLHYSTAAESVNAVNSLGDTPLHLAISHGSTGVVLVLLRNGADVTLPSHSLSRLNAPMTVANLLNQLESQVIDAALADHSHNSNESSRCLVLPPSNFQELRGLKEIRMLFGEWEILEPLQLQRCCWFAFRTVCHAPRFQFSVRTKIPEAIVNEIVVYWIGPFPNDGGGEPVYLHNVRVEDENDRTAVGSSFRSGCCVQ